MNYNRNNGWYYNNGYDKSPSWSSVQYLYKFLTTNKGVGPRGREVSNLEIKEGDIAQLSFNGNTFSHSLFIIKILDAKDLNKIEIATHTYDALGKRIGEYYFEKIRFIHIENVGIW